MFVNTAIILRVVLSDFDTWYRTLREEFRPRVIQNRFIRLIFGPKRDENVEWSRLQNEELRRLYR